MQRLPEKHIQDLPAEQLRILYQISKKLSRIDYRDTLIADALDIVIEFLKADRGLFCIYDAATGSMNLHTARKVDQKNITDLNTFSSGVLKQVLQKKTACLYHDAPGDPDLSQFKSIQIHNIKSVLGVPVFYGNEVWGVILVDSRENRQEFTEENLTFLEFFSSLITLVLDKVLQVENLQDENFSLRRQLSDSTYLPDIIGNSHAMQELSSLIHKVAQTDASVLILGESGTGKELVARAIHNLSSRKGQPFIAQFCGSIPDNLLESELFGYKKGAFTGAYTDKKGLFEVADKGTFLLDEIADISKALQAKLLRVLENRQILRLGDTSMRAVDVRIIAATNKNLANMVKKNEFREDLYYRLNVFPIQVPPLRERRADIPLLVKHFIKRNSHTPVGIGNKALKMLQNYEWPGNVRQLENVIKRALILSDGKEISVQHVDLEQQQDIAHFSGQLKDYEQLLLKKRLKEFNGNRTLTARSLGVSVRWVQLKLKQMEI